MTDPSLVRHVVEIVDHLGRTLRIETAPGGAMRATIQTTNGSQEEVVKINPAAQQELQAYLVQHRIQPSGTNAVPSDRIDT